MDEVKALEVEIMKQHVGRPSQVVNAILLTPSVEGASKIRGNNKKVK